MGAPRPVRSCDVARPASSVHVLKVTLSEIRPPIWRRLAVPSDITLGDLHEHLQTTMAWFDYHLHDFQIGRATYGVDDGEGWGDPPQDESTVTLADVAPEGTSFIYTYDLGDNWRHQITVEAVGAPDPNVAYPICLGGRRACPPEDCGGVPGYLELLEALADPCHERHDELLEWVGGEYDPELFDVDQTNAALAVWSRPAR